jgi:hypothetical protein
VPDLNTDQFGEKPWHPGDYRGVEGEPHPDLYPKYDDFLADHKRFVTAQKSGKKFVDRDESMLARERAAAEREVKGEYKQEQTVKRQTHQRRMKTMKGVSKGLSAWGLKPPPKRRRWG